MSHWATSSGCSSTKSSWVYLFAVGKYTTWYIISYNTLCKTSKIPYIIPLISKSRNIVVFFSGRRWELYIWKRKRRFRSSFLFQASYLIYIDSWYEIHSKQGLGWSILILVLSAQNNTQRMRNNTRKRKTSIAVIKSSAYSLNYLAKNV